MAAYKKAPDGSICFDCAHFDTHKCYLLQSFLDALDLAEGSERAPVDHCSAFLRVTKRRSEPQDIKEPPSIAEVRADGATVEPTAPVIAAQEEQESS